MRSESAAYATERVKLTTQPVYFARFRHVAAYGAGVDYPFSVDFSTGAVQGATVTKRAWLGRPSGNTQTIQPELGRSTVGTFLLPLVDVGGEVLRYLSAPALTLKTAMTAGLPTVGGWVELNEDPSGLPALGTIEITTSGVLERVRYSVVDVANRRVTVSGRGVDGTTAAAHSGGDPITNGEQIRVGQRIQLYAGYAPLAEADYLSFAKMEVVDRDLAEDGVTYRVRCADIQRGLRRTVFLGATRDEPVVLEGNPVDLALQVLTATGAGTNGAYDVLPEPDGLGIPQALVDVAGLEALRDEHFAGQVYRFSLPQRVEAKAWLEAEIWRTLNCYPVVLQDGRLSARRYQPPPLVRTAGGLGHRLVAAA